MIFKSVLKPFYMAFIVQKKKRTKNVVLTKKVPISVLLSLGRNVVLNKDVEIYNSNVRIGDYSYVNGGKYWYCSIGKYCSIGYDVFVGSGEHRMDTVTTYPIHSRLSNNNTIHSADFYPPKKVTIGNGVWIGNRVIIKQGVVVGDGAVIGAGSVVTHNVEPYSVIAGVPAKTIRFLFSQSDIQFLVQADWYNWEIEKVQTAVKKGAFKCIDDFKQYVCNQLQT